jgi:hypothetical protein
MIYINAETPNNVPHACAELEALGFEVMATRPAASWAGREPETLIIARSTELTTAMVQGLEIFAKYHKQDCVAIRLKPNVGLTIGSKPVPYKEEYFSLR